MNRAGGDARTEWWLEWGFGAKSAMARCDSEQYDRPTPQSLSLYLRPPGPASSLRREARDELDANNVAATTTVQRRGAPCGAPLSY